MLITKILGNIRDLDSTRINIVDNVYIEWFNTQKRIARYTSKQGVDIAINLEKSLKFGLNDGDILSNKDNNIIIASIIPTNIILIRAKNVFEVSKICYEIGNYHLPLFIGDSDFEFKIPYEKPIQRLLDKLCISYNEDYGILDSKDRLKISIPIIEPRVDTTNCKISINGDNK